MHRVLDTKSFLLLVLEYVPGEDLYYFLEQARDRQADLEIDIEPVLRAHGHIQFSGNDAYPDTDEQSLCESLASSESGATGSTSGRTPPSPSLLADLDARKLLSRKRLRLVASMFSQVSYFESLQLPVLGRVGAKRPHAKSFFFLLFFTVLRFHGDPHYIALPRLICVQRADVNRFSLDVRGRRSVP